MLTDSKDAPSTDCKPMYLKYKKIGVTVVVAGAVLLFTSRPFMSLMMRKLCYWQHGPSEYSFNGSFFPWEWQILQPAWHDFTGVQYCETAGHYGYNWPEAVTWMGQRGQAVITSLGGMGGGYALWRAVYQCFKKPGLNNENKELLRDLNQLIKETPDKEQDSKGKNHSQDAIRRVFTKWHAYSKKSSDSKRLNATQTKEPRNETKSQLTKK